MVSDSRSSDPDNPASESVSGSDSEMASGFDEAALYRVVHAAVKDALLDVIGTLLLVGIAFVLVVAGGQALFAATSTLGIVVGLGFVVTGLYLAATSLELIPPVYEWL